MKLSRSIRHVVHIALGIGFLYNVANSLLKWNRGKTGMNQEVKRVKEQLYPSITLCPTMLKKMPKSTANLTENYLNMVPIDKHVLAIDHKVELENG